MSGRSRAGSVRPRMTGERFTPALVAVVLAPLGGVAFHFAFDPYGWWILAPVSIGLLVAASFTRRVATAWLSGFMFGLGAFIPLFEWANIYAGIEPWLALAAFQALFISLFSVGTRLIYVRLGIRFASSLSVAALWMSVETLRASQPWGGLPWGASAYALADSPLLNVGPWIGVAGLAAMVGLLGTYIFSVLMSLAGRRRPGRTGINAVWPASVIVVVLLASFIIPRPVADIPADDPTVTIAAIQGNVEPPPPGAYYVPEEMFANHVAQTERYLEHPADVDLVLWPEDSTGWNVVSDPARMRILRDLSARANAPILIGSQVPHGNNQRLNKAIEIDADGVTGQEYVKRHPVPFGEYIPARGFFEKLTDKTALITSDMAAGDEVGVLSVGNARIGVLICFEIAYANLVHDSIHHGAQAIIVQSNNALFGYSYEAIQQRAQAKVQAVVTGRSVVHVSTVGHSAIFTPEGRVLGSVDHFEAGTMLADIPLRTHLTPAVRFDSQIRMGLHILAGFGLVRALVVPARRDGHHRGQQQRPGHAREAGRGA